MRTLREALRKYPKLRRNLGSQLRGVDSALRNFVAFAEREGASYITTDLALRWAQEPRQAQPATWASRLRMVRCFAVWLSATERRTEVPPAGLLPYRFRRQRPYIYSDAEIEAIVRAAGQLASPQGLKGRTYSTVFGLLSVTGMRVSLLPDHVDLAADARAVESLEKTFCHGVNVTRRPPGLSST